MRILISCLISLSSVFMSTKLLANRCYDYGKDYAYLIAKEECGEDWNGTADVPVNCEIDAIAGCKAYVIRYAKQLCPSVSGEWSYLKKRIVKDQCEGIN